MPRINTCKGCSSLFKTPHLNRIPEFCSRSCRKDYFKNQRQTICEYCGKAFERWQASATQKFCSYECHGKARIKNNGTHLCQLCGITFFDQKHPNRKYCSEKCFRDATKSDNPRIYKNKPKLKKITKQCLNCSKEFTIIETRVYRRFCSQTCSNRYNNHPDPTKKSIFTCKECNQEFTGWTYRNSGFCSRNCVSRYAARQPKPNLRRPENFVTKKCSVCKKPYTIHKIFVEKRNSNYCSSDCRYIGNSLRMKGENNPNYIDGLSPHNYGENWYRQRSKARKRDNATCQECGVKHDWPKVCVDAHHKIPLRLFNGDTEKANRLSNLICLCRKCHGKAEKEFRGG